MDSTKTNRYIPAFIKIKVLAELINDLPDDPAILFEFTKFASHINDCNYSYDVLNLFTKDAYAKFICDASIFRELIEYNKIDDWQINNINIIQKSYANRLDNINKISEMNL